MVERKRRFVSVLLVALALIAGAAFVDLRARLTPEPPITNANTTDVAPEGQQLAAEALGSLAVKGRAPKTDYARSQFGKIWEKAGYCDVRNYILARDLVNVKTVSDSDCTVLEGDLTDPYTGETIHFVRGPSSSASVQIDHVVALSDAWQKGAQQMELPQRQKFANDPLNLLAVDGPANIKKGDSDAATWLPTNKPYRCRYVARQIAVKQTYNLWVTEAEHDAMTQVLKSCPGQTLPVVELP
ncbi:MAG: HNH endonuclease family protein [Candidatus Saccharimonadales bacterium]